MQIMSLNVLEVFAVVVLELVVRSEVLEETEETGEVLPVASVHVRGDVSQCPDKAAALLGGLVDGRLPVAIPQAVPAFQFHSRQCKLALSKSY